MRAVVGSVLLDGDTTALSIDTIVKHEAYSAQSLANDLALIKLKTAIDLNYFDGFVNSVCLPPRGQKFTQYVTVSGYDVIRII